MNGNREQILISDATSPEIPCGSTYNFRLVEGILTSEHAATLETYLVGVDVGNNVNVCVDSMAMEALARHASRDRNFKGRIFDITFLYGVDSDEAKRLELARCPNTLSLPRIFATLNLGLDGSVIHHVSTSTELTAN